MIRRPTIVPVVLTLGLIATDSVLAETVVLVRGGRLHGEVVERAGSANVLFLRTASGATVGIPREQIDQLMADSVEEQRYRALRAQTDDALEDHVRLARWCEEHGLPRYRDAHWRAVLVHDPDNEEARRALGYTRRAARWMTEEQWMVSRGYVRFGRRWRLPQEVAILKRDDQRIERTGEWYRNIKRWSDWARGRDAQRRAEGLHALGQVEDHAAMEPMSELLGLSADPRARLLYVDFLARVGNAAAVDALVVHSMADRSAEVRDAAMEYLAGRFAAAALPRYVRALGHIDREIAQRAARYLAVFEDDDAIIPLIDALVTRLPVDRRTGEPTHEALRPLRRNELAVFDLSPRDIREAISGSGPRPSDLQSVLAAAKGVFEKDLPNRAARDTLVHLTGEDYGYNEARWMQWYSQELDARYRPLLEKP